MYIEPVSTKQLEILILLYRYRFLTSTQIQKFLHHKDHSLIGRYLRDLTARQIIGSISSKKRENINSPSIFYLANKSRPILLEKHKECDPAALDRIYREKSRSPNFIARCLFIADLYFHFQTAAETQKSTCSFYTATDLLNVAYTPLPLPDGYLVVKSGKKTTRYFLEYYDNKLPRFAIKAKVMRYFKYYEANYWQDHNKHPFPTMLLICPDPQAQKFLRRFIPKQLAEEELDISFFLANEPSIREKGIQSDTWEAA